MRSYNIHFVDGAPSKTLFNTETRLLLTLREYLSAGGKLNNPTGIPIPLVIEQIDIIILGRELQPLARTIGACATKPAMAGFRETSRDLAGRAKRPGGLK